MHFFKSACVCDQDGFLLFEPEQSNRTWTSCPKPKSCQHDSNAQNPKYTWLCTLIMKQNYVEGFGGCIMIPIIKYGPWRVSLLTN